MRHPVRKVMRKILMILIVLIATKSFAQSKNYVDRPYLEISGEADTLVLPDQVFLTIQLSENDNKNRIALEVTEEKMIGTLNNMGINTEKYLRVSDQVSNLKNYLFKNKTILKTRRYELELSDAQ